MASYIRPPTDLSPVFLSDLISHPLVFFVLCVPATLAFSLFLNAPRLLYLLSFSLELFFPWSFLGGLLSPSLSHMSPPQRSLPKTPNLALPVLPLTVTIT